MQDFGGDRCSVAEAGGSQFFWIYIRSLAFQPAPDFRYKPLLCINKEKVIDVRQNSMHMITDIMKT